jgi:hypothetical protein
VIGWILIIGILLFCIWMMVALKVPRERQFYDDTYTGDDPLEEFK